MVTQIEKKSRQPARPHPDRSQYSVAPSPSKRALLSVLAALNEGKFSKAVDQFEHHSNSPTMRSASSFSTRGAWSNSFTNHESFSRTPWLRQMAPSNTEITPSWNGSSRQIRSCPTDLYSAECQFPCELRPSCTWRTEESDSGPSAMTNWHLGAPVWLHFSRSGLSTSKVPANVCAHLGLSLLKIPSDAEFKQQRQIDFEFALKERIGPRSAEQMFDASLRSNNPIARSSDEV